MATHYDVLGVPVDATPAQVRQAYHQLARALHPDRLQGASPVDRERAARRMQEVNEAWRVLRDPTTRLGYDQAIGVSKRRSRAAGANGGRRPRYVSVEDDEFDDDYEIPPPPEPGDVGVAVVRALPWVAVLVVLGLIFLVTAVAGNDGRASKGAEFEGRCVASGSASAVVTVPCQGPNDGKVVLVVDRASLCPDGSTGRNIEGDRWLCLQPVHPVPAANR